MTRADARGPGAVPPGTVTPDSVLAAQIVLDELIRGGVVDIVLAPGSRSAPLALGAAAAERDGRCTLHVRVDERSAGYLAVGLAARGARPVVVITTSGTAAVNLHPAMVEAHHAGRPIIALTADRPPRLRATGAHQTIDQPRIFEPGPRVAIDLLDHDPAVLRSAVARSIAAATDDRDPGPVHLNLPLTEPLVGALLPWDELPGGRPGSAPWMRRVVVSGSAPGAGSAASSAAAAGPPLAAVLPPGATMDRGIVVVGDGAGEEAIRAVGELAGALAWPVVAEPTANAGPDMPGESLLEFGTAILERQRAAPRPDVVVTVGRIGLHRGVRRLIGEAPCHIAVDPRSVAEPADPTRTAAVLLTAVPVAGSAMPAPTEWRAAWRDLDARIARAADGSGGNRAGSLDDAAVAQTVARLAGPADLLVLGSSRPIRQVSLLGGRLRARSLANRGTSGIDGVVSTAWGAALAHRREQPEGLTIALVGDLTALYDRNGLIVPRVEEVPRLAYVVVDNNGGGIFADLEQGAPEYARDFDRVFRTPHDTDLTTLLTGPHSRVREVRTPGELESAVEAARAGGVHVIVARVD